MPSFRDRFAFAGGSYASFRPSYPEALFQWLAATTRRRERVWDCGTGTGQAAAALRRYFGEVVATDASVTQLESATSLAAVSYVAMSAEATALAAHCADLVTVAQALHWFDRPRFFGEVDRVLVPGGTLAVWSYGFLSLEPSIDSLLLHLYEDVLGPYWPPERALVDGGYRAISLPYVEEPAPAFGMEATWSLRQLVGYLSTWSAVGRYRADTGADPMPEVEQRLHSVWGAEPARSVRWPLVVRISRKPM